MPALGFFPGLRCWQASVPQSDVSFGRRQSSSQFEELRLRAVARRERRHTFDTHDETETGPAVRDRSSCTDPQGFQDWSHPTRRRHQGADAPPATHRATRAVCDPHCVRRRYSQLRTSPCCSLRRWGPGTPVDLSSRPPLTCIVLYRINKTPRMAFHLRNQSRTVECSRKIHPCRTHRLHCRQVAIPRT